MNWADNAVLFISEILIGNVLPFDDILFEILHAPASIRRSLTRRLQNLEQLEKFLQSQKEHFIVENRKVVVYEKELEIGREKAVAYFEKKLCLYDEEHPRCSEFRRHIGQAEKDVIYFFRTFYPNKEEFKHFLLAHSDVFFLFDDETVCLINYINFESLTYFKERLANREGLYFMNLRGHLGQAPGRVTEFINTRYPKKCFLDFLIGNADVFFVSDKGAVCLIENECIDYFEECLQRKAKLYFMNLHGHLGQAPDHVIEFINTYYPGKKFMNFLRKNARVFFVQDDGTVSLVESECIDYFKEFLANNRQGLHFTDLKRHLRQAPDHVIDFVNAQSPETSFIDFLVKNPDVFHVQGDGTVSLIENDCIDYFRKCLVNRRGLYFMNLHGHLGQAPDHVIEFMNTEYPVKDFFEFFEKHADVFLVHANGTVSLKMKK